MNDRTHPLSSDVVQQETRRVAETLESVRLRLEERFLQAGTAMASALEGVEALIQSLDSLNGALAGEASIKAIAALQDTANDMLGLPAVQAERRDAFGALVGRSEALGANIGNMHTRLRYLRSFALNLKITAAAAPQFVGFAQEVMDRIALGAAKLATFGAKHAGLDEQLRCALGFVHELDTDCEQHAPAVVSALQTSAQAIQTHNRDTGVIAVQVTGLVRRIHANIAAALNAMQIGDSTRQRIEHVEAGLALLQRDNASDDTVLRVLLEQVDDLTTVFAADATILGDKLLSLSEDAHEVLRLKSLISEGQSGAFLKDLESKVGQAQGVVDQVRTVNSQAGEAGRAVAGAIETLLANVDAILSVKTDIRYMAINTSLRCGRMGEAGKPVNVIGLELRDCADKLGETADNTMGVLDALADGAHRFVDRETDADLGGELGQALTNIRQASARADADLTLVVQKSADVADAMESLSANARFHEDFRQALEQAHAALARIAPPAPDRRATPDAVSSATLEEIFNLYTMKREREIHRLIVPAAAPAWEPEEMDKRVASARF